MRERLNFKKIRSFQPTLAGGIFSWTARGRELVIQNIIETFATFLRLAMLAIFYQD